MAQSPELAGGVGFTFEDRVSAKYLAALLGQDFAPGISGRTVCRVALQQRDFGEPLDDVIVDFQTCDGDRARLSLQLKRSLTISSAPSNKDFREVIRDSWHTFNKGDFRRGIDRFGPVVGEIASGKVRDLRLLCEFAKASTTLDEFELRFAEGGPASIPVRDIRNDIAALIRLAAGEDCSNQDLKDFLAHLVIITFDFLHEGQTSLAEALSMLRRCLKSGDPATTLALWDRLCNLAREGDGLSEVFTRPALIRKLSTTFELVASQALQGDLQRLAALARQWLDDIVDDIGGICIERSVLLEELTEKIDSCRWIQIRGLPGSGKSVLLRRLAEADLARGPILFLKSDRLEGAAWASFATANALSDASLPDLLVELAATGSGTLYIDGIDRVEKQHRGIILDVLRQIMENPLLNNWRVAVSLRDTGIEPLRTWLGSVLGYTDIEVVEVKSFDDQEADALAKEKPHLRPLLFGHSHVKEIVRRPFFAKILVQNFRSSTHSEAFKPQSEVDLIGYWWERGGYDEEGSAALKRQRAIIELGLQRARHLDRDIAVRELPPAITDIIDQLVADGILQHVRSGHSLRFSHDIFFEWAFFHTLIDADDWLEEIRSCGEPPAVARVVELLSQEEFSQVEKWAKMLHSIKDSEMRPQWTRAWLLAPLAVPNFYIKETSYYSILEANEHHFLKKALVWFQAERTIPNPNVLAGNFSPEERIRYADLLGWPSDFQVWSRFIYFLLGHISDIPAPLLPGVIIIFQVWQNALSGIRNPISDALLEQSASWLTELLGQSVAANSSPEILSRWESLGKALGEFKNTLSQLILRSAEGRPDLVQEYLAQVIGSKDLRREKYNEVIAFSPTLARTHPSLLVDFACIYLRQELPKKFREREQRELVKNLERRKQILAMPSEEHTRLEELSCMHPPRGMHSFGYHDWERLSVDDNITGYFPPSPLREPFKSLFEFAPDQALQLLTNLSNHAMTAWLQLHELAHNSPGTPVPLEIEFPWGRQQFWGRDREYLWSRGTWAPKPIACGYLALEQWALEEIEHGRPADELIQRILLGNQCIAVLGVAIVIALQTNTFSDAIFPIVTSQRLLAADRHRWEHDITNASAGLIGFSGKKDFHHVEVVKKINARPVRQIELSRLLSCYFLNHDFRERTKSVVNDFVHNLPFQYENQRTNPDVQEHLRQQAMEYAELVHLEYYQRVPLANGDDRIAVVHVSPMASSPERLARAQHAEKYLRVSHLLVWGSRYFETGLMNDEFTIQSALDLAKGITGEGLFEAPGGDNVEIRMQRCAVTATAAIALDRREGIVESDLTWCRQVLKQACSLSESDDISLDLYTTHPWHPCTFVAKGLCAEILHGTAGSSSAHELLCLIAHPLEVVSLAALGAALFLWDKDPRLGWCALYLSLSLCIISQPEKSVAGLVDETPSREKGLVAIKEVTTFYDTFHGWPHLPSPPAPWVRVEEKEQGCKVYDEYYSLPDPSKSGDVREQWAPSPTLWDDDRAAKVIALIPLEAILQSPAGPRLLDFLAGLLPWTCFWLMPPWAKRWGDNASHRYDWTHSVGEVLGKVAGLCSLTDFEVRFLKPMFDLDDEACFEFLARFVDVYICKYVYDIKEVAPDFLAIVMRCLNRLLDANCFVPGAYRSGELYGYDVPSLAKVLMFVPLEFNVGGSERFANGNWSDIDLVLPVVDRFVKSAGWAVSIMSLFLELCERAKEFYPAEHFADQVLHVVGSTDTPLKGWNGTLLTARIAGLIQHLVDRDAPVPLELAQKFLRILDFLIDMGDRRSAALQISETFREVQCTACADGEFH